MKKQFKLGILAVAVLFASAVSAQKNSKIVSGTLAYTKAKDVDAEYSVNPLVGYFVTDNVAVGVLGSFGKTSTEKTTNIGAFARCHFMKIGKNCQVFSQLDLTANSATSNDTLSVKTKSTCANLGLGANYSITKKLDLTMHVANLISYEKSGDLSVTTVGFTGVNNPFATAGFGVIYKF